MDNDTRTLFGVLMARLLEDELSRDVETGLLDACLNSVARETLAELERRIKEALTGTHTSAHLERMAARMRARIEHGA